MLPPFQQMLNHDQLSSPGISATSEDTYGALCSRLGMKTEEECHQMVELCSFIGADTPGQCELLINNALNAGPE